MWSLLDFNSSPRGAHDHEGWHWLKLSTFENHLMAQPWTVCCIRFFFSWRHFVAILQHTPALVIRKQKYYCTSSSSFTCDHVLSLVKVAVFLLVCFCILRCLPFFQIVNPVPKGTAFNLRLPNVFYIFLFSGKFEIRDVVTNWLSIKSHSWRFWGNYWAKTHVAFLLLSTLSRCMLRTRAVGCASWSN